MPSQPLIATSLPIASLLFLLVAPGTMAEAQIRYRGDGRYAIEAHLKLSGVPEPSLSKHAETGPRSSARGHAGGARFVVLAALNSNGHSPKGALVCGPVDDVFGNGFE